jgi:hypothetical protein
VKPLLGSRKLLGRRDSKRLRVCLFSHTCKLITHHLGTQERATREMSWRSVHRGYDNVQWRTVVICAVVTLILAAGWVVPCAGQVCSPVSLAYLADDGKTDPFPTIAQRLLIGSNPVTIASVSLELYLGAPPPPPSPSAACVSQVSLLAISSSLVLSRDWVRV